MTLNNGTTVLVVEDEPLVRMSIVLHLEDAGYTVLEAGNADDAVEILQANTAITIMFTDIDMPGGMNGLKLAAAVRDRWPPIKIIITSGHHVLGVDQLPAEVQFIPKPYNPDRIVSAFRQMSAG
jgi:CheY-like chemotaxis protein